MAGGHYGDAWVDYARPTMAVPLHKVLVLVSYMVDMTARNMDLQLVHVQYKPKSIPRLLNHPADIIGNFTGIMEIISETFPLLFSDCLDPNSI